MAFDAPLEAFARPQRSGKGNDNRWLILIRILDFNDFCSFASVADDKCC